MIDVLNLALPYFGLIFLGFACGRFKSIPDKAHHRNVAGAGDAVCVPL